MWSFPSGLFISLIEIFIFYKCHTVLITMSNESSLDKSSKIALLLDLISYEFRKRLSISTEKPDRLGLH